MRRGGLTGLVGTPQYVAPEVVKGFGDDSPTEIPYGKGCDLWSMVRPRHAPPAAAACPAAPRALSPLPLPLTTTRLLSSQGVLLYVMLSKTMPFRAKDIDKLLRQVVKGKFTFMPEAWRPRLGRGARPDHQAAVRRPVAKRLTIADVKARTVVRGGGRQAMATMPKVKAAPAPPKSAGGAAACSRASASAAARRGRRSCRRCRRGRKKSPFGVGYVSKEAQYWCEIGDGGRTAHTHPPRRLPPHPAPRAPAPLRYDIGDPTDVKQTAGAKLNADGTFNMDNGSRGDEGDPRRHRGEDEARGRRGGGGRVSVQVPAGARRRRARRRRRRRARRPTPVWTRRRAARRAQRTETNAMKHRDSAAMDTMLLINEKDEEILEAAAGARYGAFSHPAHVRRPSAPFADAPTP